MLAPNFGFLAPMDFVRFWGSIQTGEVDECWPWRHSTNDSGYGCFSLKGTLEIASRISYQVVHGRIPDDLIVRHSCDNPPCCNPRHLLTGTHLDNAKDRHVRGRTNRGRSVHTVVLTEADVMRIRATPQPQWSALSPPGWCLESPPGGKLNLITKGISMIEAHLKLLGTVMKDKVTGIKGMVDSVSFDAYGCVQASLRPPANKDGTLSNGMWFDVKRLEVAGKRLMPVPPFLEPGKEIGAATKPAFSSLPPR